MSDSFTEALEEKQAEQAEAKENEDKFLEPLTGEIKEIPIIVYDVESKDGDSQRPGFTRPFMVTFFDGVNAIVFRNAKKVQHLPWETRHLEDGGCIDRVMRHMLKKKYQKGNIYAHNGGSFDHLFLLPWLKRHPEYDFSITPVQSSIQRIDVWKRNSANKRHKWSFLDSMRLIPMGLDKAAKSFNLVGKKEIDLALHEDDKTWDEYNRVDCQVLWSVLTRAKGLIETLGGEVGMTAPSTAMKLFRRRYLGQGTTPARVPRHRHFDGCPEVGCNGCLHEWVRLGYYGGRTEIHTMRGTGLRYFDLNSSYPASMKFSMPAGDKIEAKELDWRYLERYVGFVECTVHIPEDCEIPPLPYRAPSGKLIFPAGTFSGVWDAEELKLLEEPLVNGKILSVRKVVWYARRPLFGEMVDVLYAYRNKSREDYDEGLSTIAKLMLNSLYGKFGMKEDRQTILMPQIPQTPRECFLCHTEVGPEVVLCPGCVGSKPSTSEVDCPVWYQSSRVSAPYIIPQIAAHITTLARIRLWNVMKEVLELGGVIQYCDTDSVITNVELTTGPLLGELKDEYPGELLDGEFIQPKVYILSKAKPFGGEHGPNCPDKKTCKGCSHSKIAMKGLPKPQRTLENLRHLQKGGVVRFRRLEKVRSMARARFDVPAKMSDVSKSFQTTYDKRIVLPNGRTRAIVLNETHDETTPVKQP